MVANIATKIGEREVARDEEIGVTACGVPGGRGVKGTPVELVVGVELVVELPVPVCPVDGPVAVGPGPVGFVVVPLEGCALVPPPGVGFVGGGLIGAVPPKEPGGPTGTEPPGVEPGVVQVLGHDVGTGAILLGDPEHVPLALHSNWAEVAPKFCQ